METITKERVALRLRRAVKTVYLISVVFLVVEDVSTYIGLSYREGLIEVGLSSFFMRLFGLTWGIIIAFLLPFLFMTGLYLVARRCLLLESGHFQLWFLSLNARSTFSKCFRFLTALCLGLFISAFNDSYALFFGYPPIGLLPPVERYLFYLFIILIGLLYALIIERQIRS